VHGCLPGGERYLPLEIADVFRAHGAAYRQTRLLTAVQLQAMRAIEACRTAALGGHLDRCKSCGFESPSFNSCRNRHCPKCQGLRQLRWIAARSRWILPTHYFHVVFTLPAELREFPRRYRRVLYRLLFETAAQALLILGRDPQRLGATIGLTAVLHTWTRDLRFHPHLHCIVTGGGLTADGQHWVGVKSGRFLFPVKVLSQFFRGKFVAALRHEYERGEFEMPRSEFDRLTQRLYDQEWVVYSKRPFGGAKQVYRYLGLYTHRVAISNSRLKAMNDQGVHFLTRAGKVVTLSPSAFIGRFLTHVLPKGFVKVRHYGLLASSHVKQQIGRARELLETNSQTPSAPFTSPLGLSWQEWLRLLLGVDVTRCPRCQEGTLVRVPLPSQLVTHPRAPPSV
jgi:hypothetical protein